jgi:hypothetical protein
MFPAKRVILKVFVEKWKNIKRRTDAKLWKSAENHSKAKL